VIVALAVIGTQYHANLNFQEDNQHGHNGTSPLKKPPRIDLHMQGKQPLAGSIRKLACPLRWVFPDPGW
jgi:hypothetical protein